MGTVQSLPPDELSYVLQQAREQVAAAEVLMAQPWSEGELDAWATRTLRILRAAFGPDDDFVRGFENPRPVTTRMPSPVATVAQRDAIVMENRNARVRSRLPMLAEAIREIEEQLERVPADAHEAAPSSGARGLPAEDFAFVADQSLRGIVVSDYGELRSIVALRATKAKAMLAGSIVEALLMDALLRQGRPLNALDRLTFAELIGAAVAARAIKVETGNAAKPVKDYRNYVHPAVQLRADRALREVDVEAAIALMRLVIEDLR